MKLFLKLSTFIVAIGLANVASAVDTYLYITGSTAYRSQTHQAILKYLGATGVSSSASPATADLGAGNKYGYVGTTWSSAAAATFIKVVGADRTIIKTSWSGSEAGIQAVCNPGTVTVKFLPASFDSAADATLTQTGKASLTNPQTSSTATDYESHTADACMSDTYQSSSRFTSPTLTDATAGGSPQPVGIIPFVWVVGKGAPAGITNISPNAAQALYKSGGIISAMVLSGNSADEAVRIYGCGRDIDSGTRVTAFAESGIGINSAVKQWRPNLPQGSTTVTAFAAVSGATYTYDTTSNTITLATGTVSGSNIALGMTVTGTGIPTGTIVGSFTDSTHFKIVKAADGTASTPTSSATGGSLTISRNSTYKMSTTGSQTAANSLYWSQYPIQVINGISSTSVGNGGESSGGTVAGYLTSTATNTTGYGLTYLGFSDANTAVKGGAVPLTYNGVAIWSSYSTSGIVSDFSNIQKGTYKFWGYEHLFYNASTIAAGVKTIADGVANQLFTTDAQILIDANLKVSRSTDGGPVVYSGTLN